MLPGGPKKPKAKASAAKGKAAKRKQQEAEPGEVEDEGDGSKATAENKQDEGSKAAAAENKKDGGSETRAAENEKDGGVEASATGIRNVWGGCFISAALGGQVARRHVKRRLQFDDVAAEQPAVAMASEASQESVCVHDNPWSDVHISVFNIFINMIVPNMTWIKPKTLNTT